MKNAFRRLFVLSLSLPVLAGCGAKGSSSPLPSSTPASSSEETPSSSVVTPSLVFHYQRADKSYKTWALWLWEKGKDGAEFAFNGTDDYGVFASYPLSTWSSSVTSNGMGFIVKSAGSWSAKDPDNSPDRFIDFSKFTPDANQAYNVYLVGGDASIYDGPSHTKQDAIEEAYFSSATSLYAGFSNPIVSYEVKENGVSWFSETLTEPTANLIVRLPSTKTPDPLKSYEISAVFQTSQATMSSSVLAYELYKLSSFDSAYTYTGNDLGAVYSAESTSFKVWSPAASSIVLRLYSSGTPTSVSASKGNDEHQDYPMEKGEKGVFSKTLQGDFAGRYYTYFVTNYAHPQGIEVVDPYAKSCGVNGLRGMVVDFAKTNPVGWDTYPSALSYDRKSLCVDEMHVADLTSDSTWNGPTAEAKKFAGFHRSGTTYTSAGVSYKSGFDHIKELGVNAVQLQPIFDQANDEVNATFNWGYNPLNYNCLDGVYSSDPYDGYARIKEFKSLVQDYLASGINIIMDVVYNHTASLSGTAFDILCPGYYYRYQKNGQAYNGSGCGNETASEMPMMRKFMIDSASFWAKEYKLGGFRFDLMGLHDLTTMDQLTAACKVINPNICIYGEPWTGGTSGLNELDSAKQSNGTEYQGYGAFNDQMRDALIAGGMMDKSERTWIANSETAIASLSQKKIMMGLKGQTYVSGNNILDPNKTTNYVTCHDNYTLYDRFRYGNGITDEDTLTKMAFLAESVALLSQGTSFFQGGEEFLRSKEGNSNSYNADYPVNAFHYELKAKNSAYFSLFQKLVALKTKKDFFKLEQADIASKVTSSFNNAANTLTYEIALSDTQKFKMACANGLGTADAVDFTGYNEILDSQNKTWGSSLQLSPFEVAVGTIGI